MFKSNMTPMVLLAAAALCSALRGQAPVEKFAGQIRAYTDAAASARDALATWEATAQEMPEFTKRDMALITSYMEKVVAAWTRAADALKNGDEKGGDALAKRAREMDNKRDIFNARLNWRRGQAMREYLPASEESFNVLVGDRKPDEIKEIEAFIETKKLRSEAYGRLADAAAPGADERALAALQDEVSAADVEVQVATMKLDWAGEDRNVRLWVAPDATVTSPEYTAAKQRLQEWRRKYERTYRQNRGIEHALEAQKRQYKELFEARSEAYKAAKAARDAKRGDK